MPCVTLSYATYEASIHDTTNHIYIFSNIRFAAAPTSTLRFREPQPPPTETAVQNGSIGGNCPQLLLSSDDINDPGVFEPLNISLIVVHIAAPYI
jgi:carboxylesterase type B